MFSEKRYDDDEFLSERRTFYGNQDVHHSIFQKLRFFAKLRGHVILIHEYGQCGQSLWANNIVSFAK